MRWVESGLKFNDPNPTQPTIKKNLVIQPNPTHQALKTDPTQRVGLGWIKSGWSWQVDYTPLLTTHTNNTYKPRQRNSQAQSPKTPNKPLIFSLVLRNPGIVVVVVLFLCQALVSNRYKITACMWPCRWNKRVLQHVKLVCHLKCWCSKHIYN